MHTIGRRFILSVALLLLFPACRTALPQSTESTTGVYDTQPGTGAQANAAQASPGLSIGDSSTLLNTSSPYPTAIVDRVVTDPLVVHVVTGLQQRGFPLEPLNVSRVELLQAAPGQAYQLDEGWLHLHLYDTAQAAAADAATIPRKLKNSILDWVAPPHFFQCDRLIALYLGADKEVINALTELCAPPFYATELGEAAVAPTEAPLTSIDAALMSLLRSSEPLHATNVPQIRTKVSLASGVALLYTYDALRDEEPVKVIRFSYLDWRDPVWYPDGDHYAIYGGDTSLPPVQLLTGTYVINGGPDTPETPDTIAFAGGWVSDPTVRQVRVIFSNGTQEIVPVEQGVYLAAKLDVERVLGIEAIDEAGTITYQQTGT